MIALARNVVTPPNPFTDFASMVQQANVGMAQVDPTGRFTFANPQYCVITGRTEEELYRLRMQDITHPDDLAANVPLFVACVEEGRSFKIEKRYVRPDGSHIWVENSVSRVIGSDGRTRAVLAVCFDISGRKSTELALLDSEERYRLVGRATNDVIWDWDHRTDAVVWSDSLYTIFGYTPEEAGGTIEAGLQWWSSHIHPDEREAVLSSFIEATQGQAQRWGKEYRFLASDGNYRQVIDRGYIARDASGAPIRMLGSMQDISALREARQRLQLAQEYGGVGVWSWDLETNALQVEPQFERLYGVPPGTIHTYDDWSRLMDPVALREIQAERNRALAERRPFEGEWPISRGGEQRWILSRARGEYDASGKPLRILGVNIDITDRKRSEAALRESEARLRASEARLALALRGGRIGVWEVDVETGENVWREGLGALLGLPTDAGGPAGWTEYVHPDDRAWVQASFDAAAANNDTWQADYRVVRPDGVVRWFTSRGVVVTVPGGRKVIGVTQDVTERHEAQEKLREADRQKDAFIAVLAHELRNPLAPMRTAVAIMRTHGQADPLLTRCRDVLDRQISQMARLLDDLLDVSRLTRGKLELQRAPIALREVLDAAIETSRPMLDQQQQRLVVEGQADQVMLDADGPRLIQVFGNVLNNAAKYGGPGSTIRVSIESDGGQVTVAVRDEGIGISPDFLPRVFDLFTQAAPAQAQAPGGLGIGLWLARHLVEMHGGTVDANSAGLGSGSEFVIRLPLLAGVPTAGPRPAPPAVAEMPRVSARVLVADDNADAADMMGALLAELGCVVRVVYSGDAAIDEARHFAPDVLFLDLGMPHLDGYETCRRIREQSWGQQIAIVAVTGWGQAEDRRRTLAAGFDQHLVKPVSRDDLVRVIRERQPEMPADLHR